MVKLKIDTDLIEKRIAEFESHVDFELVPVITRQSCSTNLVPWMLSLIFLLISVAVIDLIFYQINLDSWQSHNRLSYYFFAFILSFVFGGILSRFDQVNRLFLTRLQRDQQVKQKAQRVFFLKKLADLNKRNSMVLLVSVLERKIVLLPDPHLKLKNLTEIQNNLLQMLKFEFQKGDYQQGFLQAIAYLQNVLVDDFPKKSSDSTNQVSNKLIWWDE